MEGPLLYRENPVVLIIIKAFTAPIFAKEDGWISTFRASKERELLWHD